MRPCCETRAAHRPLWGARWLKTIGILMNWVDMCIGPSLLRWRSPATGVEVKRVHEESRDREMGDGVFSTVKGICRTWGCFLLVPSKFWKIRGLNSNLSVTPSQDWKTFFHWSLFIVRPTGNAKKQNKKNSRWRFAAFLLKSLLWKQHLILNYDLLLLRLNLRDPAF